jgi:hypothetical protein
MKSRSKRKKDKAGPGAQAALRALRRAVRKVHAEHRKLGLPIIIWEVGRVVEKRT